MHGLFTEKLKFNFVFLFHDCSETMVHECLPHHLRASHRATPAQGFKKCVARYQGDAHLCGFSCWDQYLAMVFAQLTYSESLRDIKSYLGAMRPKLYHMSFLGRIRRSTLADANDAHDWRIYADFAQVLIATARSLYAAEPMGVEL